MRLIGIAAIAAVLVVGSNIARAQEATLDWDSSGPLAQEYRVYQQEANTDNTCPAWPQGYGQIGTVPGEALTYIVTGLSFDKTYCWHVTAWNVDHGETGASNVASKRIPFPSLPPAPANLQVR